VSQLAQVMLIWLCPVLFGLVELAAASIGGFLTILGLFLPPCDRLLVLLLFFLAAIVAMSLLRVLVKEIRQRLPLQSILWLAEGGLILSH